MSGATARAVPVRAPAPAPRLQAVPAARAAARPRAARTPFIVVVVGVLVTGLLGLLLLNTVVSQDAFAVHDLRNSGRVLAEQEQALTREVEQLQAPEQLAKRAAELGMVPAGEPQFLHLPTGKVLGSDGKPAKPGDPAGAQTGPVTAVAPGVPTLAPKPVKTSKKSAQKQGSSSGDQSGSPGTGAPSTAGTAPAAPSTSQP